MWNGKQADQPKDTETEKDGPIAEGDVVGNFVRRTDNDFRGVHDPRLIGKDIGDDEDEENEDK